MSQRWETLRDEINQVLAFPPGTEIDLTTEPDPALFLDQEDWLLVEMEALEKGAIER